MSFSLISCVSVVRLVVAAEQMVCVLLCIAHCSVEVVGPHRDVQGGWGEAGAGGASCSSAPREPPEVPLL